MKLEIETHNGEEAVIMYSPDRKKYCAMSKKEYDQLPKDRQDDIQETMEFAIKRGLRGGSL